MRTIIFLFLCFYLSNSIAQKLESSNLYLFDLTIDKGNYELSNPQFLTNFNSEGYNNQPSFFSNNELYITVQLSTDTTQTDIYKLNLDTKTMAQVTATPDSEYSPTLLPFRFNDDDSFHFACVRVESKKEDVMRVWQFPIDRSNNGSPIFKSVKDIGYFEWMSKEEALIFIVGNPHQLSEINRNDEKVSFITSNIGRCIQKLSTNKVAYIHKLTDESWILKELDISTGFSLTINNTLQGSEDFYRLDDGTYIMARKSKIYKFKKTIDLNWVEIADLSPYGINKITRISISKDGKIALVCK